MSISGLSSDYSGHGMSDIAQLFQRPKPPEGMEGVKPGSDELFEKITDKLISEKDKDGDGALSASEFGLDEETFNAIDSDGDGLLTKVELTEDAKQRSQEMMAKMQTMQASNSGSLMDMLGQGGQQGMSRGITSYMTQQNALLSLLSENDAAMSLLA